MTNVTLKRCHCGDPMNAKGLCFHCDLHGQCNEKHDGVIQKDGPDCNPKHNWDTCVRCQTLAVWEPPEGYTDNTRRKK